MYDIDYFIKKFEAIPEDKWTTGVFESNGKCCVYGHCGSRSDDNGKEIETDESEALARVAGYGLVSINDGLEYGFGQCTPKQRVLVALYNKLKGY